MGFGALRSVGRRAIISRQFSLFTPIMSSSRITLADKYNGLEKNVWVDLIDLATKYKPLNLGQGFPDFAPPKHVTDALADVAKGDNILLQQYTRGYGHPRLVNALSKLYGQMIGRTINPFTEVLISGGAYGALFCTIMSCINPGDEVIIIEPFFDCYEPMVRLAGGIPVFIPLRPKNEEESYHSSNWILMEQELASKFNKNTKAIIVNTPNNPLGKVFTQKELEYIGNLCQKWDVLCIMDEVYEWMTYEPYQHVRMASLPGMWERTVTIGSAGKAFSTTGWKLGWAVGPEDLITCLQIAHQNCVYTCPTPSQQAAAQGFETEIAKLGQPDCYFTSLAEELKGKRDLMANVLRSTGFVPMLPEGGYFMMADYTKFKHLVPPPATEAESKEAADVRFVKWMTSTYKLATIPITCFYSKEHSHIGENY